MSQGNSNGLLKGCFIVMAVFVMMIIVGFVSCSVFFTSVVKQIAEGDKVRAEAAEKEPISEITWQEVVNAYADENDLTDLQKSELIKNMKGKKVKWNGNVTSISDDMGELLLIVEMKSEKYTTKVRIRLKESERKKGLELKNGDSVTFTGILNDQTFYSEITLKYGEIVNQEPTKSKKPKDVEEKSP